MSEMLGNGCTVPSRQRGGEAISAESHGVRFISGAQVRSLPIGVAVDALADGFLARDEDDLDGVPRSVVAVPGRPVGDEAEMLLMPAFGLEGAGLKVVAITRGNGERGLPLIQGVYVLLSAASLTPQVVIDGAALTELRTSAVSALATRYLARPESRRLVVFGAGAQARAHIDAMRAVLPIDHVTVVARSLRSARALELVTELRCKGFEAVVGEPSAVAEADVVCCCTTSTEPVFADEMLRPGVHVNAVGAYRLDMAELPIRSLARALLVVESLEATLVEAGDVVAAVNSGSLPDENFAHPLSEVLREHVTRTNPDQITIFKSVGLASEDLIVARALTDAL